MSWGTPFVDFIHLVPGSDIITYHPAACPNTEWSRRSLDHGRFQTCHARRQSYRPGLTRTRLSAGEPPWWETARVAYPGSPRGPLSLSFAAEPSAREPDLRPGWRGGGGGDGARWRSLSWSCQMRRNWRMMTKTRCCCRSCSSYPHSHRSLRSCPMRQRYCSTQKAFGWTDSDCWSCQNCLIERKN